MRDYTTYSAVDLAGDEFFLEWRLLKTEETELFWNDYVKMNPRHEPVVMKAVRIVDSVAMNKIALTEHEKSEAVENLVRRVARYRRRRLFLTVGSAAAVLVIAVTLFMSRNDRDSKFDEYVVEDTSSDIRLFISDSQAVSIDYNADIVAGDTGIVVVSSDGRTETKRISKAAQTGQAKLVIPAGKRSSLILDDGSRVYLNSGTTLDFPMAFEGDTREITVSGEIYVEAAYNPSRPFVVKAEGFTTRVLGTSFNVSAYAGNVTHSVTVAEGMVEVEDHRGENVTIEKNQRLIIDEDATAIELIDAYNVISWKDGILCLTGDSLEEVFKRLSRCYNISFSWEKRISSFMITGKLVLLDDPAIILSNIAEIVPVNWEYKNNMIVISGK